MTTDSKQFETIKSKLRKLQALAEKGDRGEAENAKRMLDQLCEKYGISLEDILDTEKTAWRRIEIGRAKIWLDLFMQCYAHVTGKAELRYSTSTASSILVQMTAYQYAEVSNLFDWHKKNLKKDIEDTQKLVFEAYVQKHRIFRDRSNDPDEPEERQEEEKPIDLAHIRRLMAMMETLNDNRYHKMIENR